MAYRIPGIVVTIVNDAGAVAPVIFERYPVYIGEGDPYRLVTNANIVRGAGNTDSLGSITTVNEIVSVGDLPGIAKYVETTDYTLSGNDIDWSAGGDEPTAGSTYYVTYTETRPASAYQPILYFDENLIYANHGNQIRTDSSVNDVSVAGMLGIQAGSGGVIILQLDLSAATDPDNPTATELENAFIAARDLLEAITDYKLFLVPMSSGMINTTTAADIFWNHAVVASQPVNKQERTVIMALPKNTTYTSAATTAQSYSNERMVVPLVKDATVSVTGVTGTHDMRFYNAALAGKLCSVPIGRNISDEVIPNVSFEDNFTPNELNYLVQRGVSPAKIRGSVVRNILSITTDGTSALTEDLGVQDVKDYVKKYWREGLWAIYRNKPINSQLLASIATSSIGILEYLKDRLIVDDYKDIAAAQDSVEPRRVNVSGRIKPAFGLQWMDVTFTFVLSFTS
jgi:hypothetical protein